MSAKHSDVHLFWGDLPEKIAANIAEIREMARAHDRHREIGFGMRLQVICRENEKDAWEAADPTRAARDLAAAEAGDENALHQVGSQPARAAARARARRPAAAASMDRDHKGASRAGIAVVGNPEQCAGTLQQFIDAGLSLVLPVGLSARQEAERFGRLTPADPRGKPIAGGSRRKFLCPGRSAARVLPGRGPFYFAWGCFRDFGSRPSGAPPVLRPARSPFRSATARCRRA